ncbi:MAG: cupin domain-containing protein [Gammaproteobacteria bacterium]
MTLAGAAVACAFGVVALRLAWATPGSGVATTILTGPVVFDEIDAGSETDDHEVEIRAKGFSDVYIVHNKIPPGGHTGWHSHPGISFVTVKAGVATEYHGDDPTPSVYPAGTGLVEEAGRVHLFANEGSVDLELVAFQIIPMGATRRIDEPAP